MNKKKALSIGIGDFLLLIGAAAIICGILFIVKPDGSMLNLSKDVLKDSPFKDFLIPGIILLVFNGVLSIIGAFLLFINYRYAGVGVMLLGAIMIIWILTQVYWIGWESWLQPTLLVVGVLEFLIGIFLDSKNNWGLFGGHHGSHAH